MDEGNTQISSPIFDLSNNVNPYISYYRWFFNEGGNGTPNDTFMVRLSNGIETKMVELVLFNDNQQSRWKFVKHRIKDFIQPTANMKVSFYASDYASSGHLVEAGADVFEVTDSSVASVIDEVPFSKIGLKQILMNGIKYVQITETESEASVLEFYDVLGRSIKQFNVKQHDLVEVPNTTVQLIFATLLSNHKRTTIKIY